MDDRLTRIQSFLVAHNLSADTITRGRMSQMEKADDAIQKRLKEAADAKEKLKSSEINVSAIAQDTGISRKTFYNNELLRLYVESYAAAEIDSGIPASDYERLKSMNNELRAQIQAFILRDIDSENLRHENMKLRQEIATLTIRTQNLERQYEQALSQISGARRKTAGTPDYAIDTSEEKQPS